MASSHILVLGGTGFIGSALVQALALDPAVRLTLLLHRRAAPVPPDRFRVLRGDLSCPDWRALEADPPAVVFHLARRLGRGRLGRWRAAALGWLANRRLVAALRGLPVAPKVVYVSGSLMYGSRGEAWVDEDTPLAPTGFARQYALAEAPWVQVQRRGTLPVVLVRPPWVLGPGSWFTQFYYEPARQRGAVPCYGPGDNWMTFIHLADCAALLAHLGRWGAPGATYNLASPPPWRQREFARRLAELLSLPVQSVAWAEVPGGRDPGLREALSSSIRLRSKHEAALATCPRRFACPDAALADVLTQLGRPPLARQSPSSR